jgi:hypothetical protein
MNRVFTVMLIATAFYERTTALRLPTMHQWPENAKEGAR